MQLKFSVPGTPCGKGRPRFFGGHAVTPAKTRNYEALVKYEASHALDTMVVKPDYSQPCRVGIKAFFGVPKSYTKKQRALISEYGSSRVRPGKPDIDNIIKAILDGMNAIIYRDDVQVTELRASKLWACDGEQPRVEVCVEWDDAD